jgi:hypothetical protein
LKPGRPSRIASRLFGLTIAALCLAASSFAQAPPQPVVLDRVVAVVNNQAILLSDLNEEIRLAILDASASGPLSRPRALDQLVSRALIQQQMRQDDTQAAAPAASEVDARINQMRKDLPACAHHVCQSDSDWNSFLAAHGLSVERVLAYTRYRIQMLRFIEQHFQQRIRVSQDDVAAYYRDQLKPKYAPGQAVPPLEEVATRIQEILLQQQVNALFDDWLKNLRQQGDVQVLDPSLETPDSPAGGGGDIND